MKFLYRKTIEVNGCYIGDPCYATNHSPTDFYADWGKKEYVDSPDLGNKALIYGTGIGDGNFPMYLRGDLDAIKHTTPLFHKFGVDAGVLGVVNAQYATSRNEDRDFLLYIPNAIQVTMRVWERKNGTRCFGWTIVTKEPDGYEYPLLVNTII